MKAVRVFKTQDDDGNDLAFEFRRPSQKIISTAELVSRARYSEAFRAGVLVNKEVFKALRERGLWGDEEEEENDRLKDKITKLEDKLRDPGISNDEGLALVAKLKAARLAQREHTSVVTNVTDATCESIANEERNMFYAASCTYNRNTGQKVYKDLEDFKSRLNELQTVEAYREATQDLPSDLSTQYTENKWLAERDLLESDDEEEQATESEPEEVKPQKKKRGRRKKVASS
jgi:hypothetical protein